MTYKEQLLDPRWNGKRLEILKEDNFTCQYCGIRNTILHVHHVEYTGMAWDAENDSLITLCADCHKIHHLHGTFSELEQEVIFMIRLAVLYSEGKDNASICISQRLNKIILKRINAKN